MNDDKVHTTLDEIFQFENTYVCSAENLTKRSSVLLLCLVRFSAEQTLCILVNSYSESINMIEKYKDVKYTRSFQISIKRVPKKLEITEG